MTNAGKWLLILIFAVAIAVRVADLNRPINRASWRECDVGAVARNYATESMNPFYPRIDWRGTTPGYAEMEFPLYPYLVALSYKVFGVDDVIARVWAFIFSLGTLWYFFRLARENLGGTAFVGAMAFFAFNPTIVEFSTSIQPEGLMILFYVAAVYYFLKWLDTEDDGMFVRAALTTALALLAKATAAHLGLFFGVLLIGKYGLGVFRQLRVWIFGVVAVFPAAIWYLHAKSLWRNYGNSLGVSNEYHWIGADFLTNSYFIKGILFNELEVVWVYFGIVIGGLAVVAGIREQIVRRSLLWTASAFLLYIVAARTTADNWASYYHIFSIPAAGLLFGAGFAVLIDRLASLISFFGGFRRTERIATTVFAVLVGSAALAAFLFEARQVRAVILNDRVADENYICAQKLAPLLKKPGLVLVSGSHCFDPDGYEVAYNASFMFYWLERKGFNICTEQQSVAKVREFAAKGAQYFIAQKSIVAQKPDFADELRRSFPLVAECDDFFVFEL